jgi:hypothetical protein
MSPHHHPNEQADYQAALDSAENAIVGEGKTFLETMELIIEDECKFTHLLYLLNLLQNPSDYSIEATTLRDWLRGEVRDYARRKAETEVQNNYWRNR